MNPYDGQVFFMLWQHYCAKPGVVTGSEQKSRVGTCCDAQSIIDGPEDARYRVAARGLVNYKQIPRCTSPNGLREAYKYNASQHCNRDRSTLHCPRKPARNLLRRHNRWVHHPPRVRNLRASHLSRQTSLQQLRR